MSCGGSGVCGFCGGCGCGNCNYTVVLPSSTDTGNAITAGANVNLTGVGFYDSQSGSTLQFRGAESATPALTIVLNATNHTLVFTIDIDALAAGLPQATTTQIGVGETATDAEAQAKASTIVFLTPSNLAALGASETFVGLIEIADQTEADAGSNDTKAITPLKMVTYLATQTNLPALWTDAVSRASLVPNVVGQLGSEITSGMSYTAFGPAAGNWNQNFQIGTTGQAPNNEINFNTNVSLDNGAYLVFAGTGGVAFSNTSVEFQCNIDLNLNTLGRLYNNGVIVPASSVLLTSSTAGEFSSALVNTFLSSANTQTGWSATNVVTTRVFDAATASLGDLRNFVGTLLNDIKALKLPAT